MAVIYVDSVGGNNGNSGATWILAKASLTGAQAIAAAGDTIYVSHVHNETTAASVTVNWPGTPTNPNRIICVNNGAIPPTTLATTGVVTVTGVSNLSINGSVYVYGLTFRTTLAGNGGSLIFCNGTGDKGVYEQCVFDVNNTNAATAVGVGFNATNITKFINCNIKFGATGQALQVTGGQFNWLGGGIVSGGSTPTTLFKYTTPPCAVLVEGVDFSNYANTFVMTLDVGGVSRFVVRNCKMPSGWTASTSMISSITTFGNSVDLYNSDSSATTYTQSKNNYYGNINHESVVILTGGATNGVTSYSLKVVSGANTKFPITAVQVQALPVWVSSTGSKTFTIEFLHDSVTALNNDEIFLELCYLGSNATPVSTLSSTRNDCLATPAAVTSSSATWVTTGITNPNKQKLSVTATVNLVGFVIPVVYLAKPSKTVYIDPKTTVA